MACTKSNGSKDTSANPGFEQIPVCLWFLAKDKSGRAALPRRRDQSGTRSNTRLPSRDRRQQTLFIDARKLGELIDRVHRELTAADLQKITTTYRHWRGEKDPGKYGNDDDGVSWRFLSQKNESSLTLAA